MFNTLWSVTDSSMVIINRLSQKVFHQISSQEQNKKKKDKKGKKKRRQNGRNPKDR